MNSIYFIGFMGSGKTTIGKKMSEKLNARYLDTDQEIEKRYQQTIPTIFAEQGENIFRHYETEVLKSTAPARIISTGGGIVEKQENINIMQESGLVIYLKASFNEIIGRLQDDKSRPLWNRTSLDQERLYKRRVKLYEMCSDEIIDTDQKKPNQIVKEIMEKLEHKYPDKMP